MLLWNESPVLYTQPWLCSDWSPHDRRVHYAFCMVIMVHFSNCTRYFGAWLTGLACFHGNIPMKRKFCGKRARFVCCQSETLCTKNSGRPTSDTLRLLGESRLICRTERESWVITCIPHQVRPHCHAEKPNVQCRMTPRVTVGPGDHAHAIPPSDEILRLERVLQNVLSRFLWQMCVNGKEPHLCADWW